MQLFGCSGVPLAGKKPAGQFAGMNVSVAWVGWERSGTACEASVNGVA